MLSNISEIGFTSTISNQSACLDYQKNTLSEHSKLYAINLFNTYNFNTVQKEFIHQLLQMKEKFPVQSEKLTNRITTLIREVASRLTFTEDSTTEFANAFPCTIEFGGKSYQCAEAAFQAQKYTDQPQIMELFTSCDAQRATYLASDTPMTDQRKFTWEHLQAFDNQDEVIRRVLKAKFEQNPILKEKLLETGSSNLVCQGGDLYLHDGFDGSGINILGLILMQLREKYHTASMLNRCGSITNNLSHDIIIKIFDTCLNRGDANSIWSLALLNKQFNESIPHVSAMEPEDIYKICPQLKVVDAKVSTKFGIKINDDPGLYPSQILRFYREMVSHVEENAGVMLLTLAEDFNPYVLLCDVLSQGIEVINNCTDDDLELLNVSLGETTILMLPIGFFKNSRNKTYTKQKEEMLRPLGCEVVTPAAVIALWFFTSHLSKKWLFDDSFIRTSTYMPGWEEYDEENRVRLCFGNDEHKVYFTDDCSDDYCRGDLGAIGMRKLDSYKKVMPIQLKPVNCKISEWDIKLAVQSAAQGNLAEAFALFDKHDFKQAQRMFINQILQLCKRYPSQATNLQSQLASLVKKATDHICVSEDPSSHLSNAYPCTIELNGKIYQCAEAALQAQKYRDQPQIMDLFCECNGEEAIELAGSTPMTNACMLSWEEPFAGDLYKDNALMQVLKAKFNQNFFLKDFLLDTESSHLVCQGSDAYFNQNSNGAGLNILGLSLMQLRDEYKVKFQ